MNEELNKKLAEWAGLVLFTDEYGVVYEYQADVKERKPMMRKYPPNFPESFDACIKHLVPKAIQEFGRDRVYIAMIDAFKHYIYLDEELALALCLAIEKLIDGEK